MRWLKYFAPDLISSHTSWPLFVRVQVWLVKNLCCSTVDVFMPLLAITHRKAFSSWAVHPCVTIYWTFVNTYFTSCLWEFHQIYSLGAGWAEMNWLDFEVKRSKVKVMMRPNVVKNHLFKNRPIQRRHTGWLFDIEDHLAFIRSQLVWWTYVRLISDSRTYTGQVHGVFALVILIWCAVARAFITVCYLHQGGHVLPGVCLFVCLSVCNFS